MKRNKYVVTGVNGYLAGFIVDELLKQEPNAEIIGVLRKGGTLRDGLSDKISTVIEYDKDDLKSLENSNFEGVTALFHAGAYYTTKKTIEEENALIESNILFTLDVNNALMKMSPDAIFVGASTFSAYNRNHEFEPQNIYSSMKYYMERHLVKINPNARFITMSDTYGPHDSRPKVHNLLMNGTIKKMNSPAEQIINLNHIEDVARAFIYLAHLGLTKDDCRVYDILDDETEITLGILVELLELEDIEFGDGEINEIPVQRRPLPGFVRIHSINEIKETLEEE